MKPNPYLNLTAMLLATVFTASCGGSNDKSTSSSAGNTSTGTSTNTGTGANGGTAPAPSSKSGLSLVAGTLGLSDGGGTEYLDGPARSARFASNYGVFDSKGNLYFTDPIQGLVRQLSPNGQVTTYAGHAAGNSSSTDGSLASATFASPQAIAIDRNDNLYVADQGSCKIRKISQAGTVTTLAGGTQQAGCISQVDGASSAAMFGTISALAVDKSGNLYAADYVQLTQPTRVQISTIRKITPSGVVATVAGGTRGLQDGTGTSAQIDSPLQSLAIDANGTLYFAEPNNQTVRTLSSTGSVKTFANFANQTNSPLTGSTLGGVVVSSTGAVYYVSSNSGVPNQAGGQIFKLNQDGTLTALVGGTTGQNSTVPLDGTASSAFLSYPGNLVADTSGNLYVFDSDGTNRYSQIRKIDASGNVTTIAGAPVAAFGNSDGSASSVLFNSPSGVAFDAAGNIYVADTQNATIRKISSTGLVTTIAGQSGTHGTADGQGASAQFSNPTALTIDAAGNLYVADGYVIRKVTPTGMVSTLTGVNANSSAHQSNSPDVDGPAGTAGFSNISDIKADAAGNIYVSEGNAFVSAIVARACAQTSAGRKGCRQGNIIRKVAPDGTVTTIAGTVGVSGYKDGAGSSAQFNSPSALAVDKAGNIYVADSANYVVRKITPTGQVSTLAGIAGTLGALDSNASAPAGQFVNPIAMTVDSNGNLYVFDGALATSSQAYPSSIRKITPAGVVSTLVRSANPPYLAVQTGSAPMFAAQPNGFTIGPDGGVYMTMENAILVYRP